MPERTHLLGLALLAAWATTAAAESCYRLPLENWQVAFRPTSGARSYRWDAMVSEDAVAYWVHDRQGEYGASAKDRFQRTFHRARFGKDPAATPAFSKFARAWSQHQVLAGKHIYVLGSSRPGPMALTVFTAGGDQALEGRYSAFEAAGSLGVLVRDADSRLHLVSAARSSIDLEAAIPRLREGPCQDDDGCEGTAVRRALTDGDQVWIASRFGRWFQLTLEASGARVREVAEQTRRGRRLKGLAMIGSARRPFGLNAEGLWSPSRGKGFRRVLREDDLPEAGLQDPQRWFADRVTGDLWARGDRALYRLDLDERELVRAASLPAAAPTISSLHARAGVLFAWVHERGLLTLTTRCQDDERARQAFDRLHGSES